MNVYWVAKSASPNETASIQAEIMSNRFIPVFAQHLVDHHGMPVYMSKIIVSPPKVQVLRVPTPAPTTARPTPAPMVQAPMQKKAPQPAGGQGIPPVTMYASVAAVAVCGLIGFCLTKRARSSGAEDSANSEEKIGLKQFSAPATVVPHQSEQDSPSSAV